MGKRVAMMRTKTKLRDAAHKHTLMPEKTPERVMSFCHSISKSPLTLLLRLAVLQHCLRLRA